MSATDSLHGASWVVHNSFRELPLEVTDAAANGPAQPAAKYGEGREALELPLLDMTYLGNDRHLVAGDFRLAGRRTLRTTNQVERKRRDGQQVRWRRGRSKEAIVNEVGKKDLAGHVTASASEGWVGDESLGQRFRLDGDATNTKKSRYAAGFSTNWGALALAKPNPTPCQRRTGQRFLSDAGGQVGRNGRTWLDPCPKSRVCVVSLSHLARPTGNGNFAFRVPPGLA